MAAGLLAIAAVLAGCQAPAPEASPTQTPTVGPIPGPPAPPIVVRPDLLAHNRSGPQPVPAAYANLTLHLLPVGAAGSEPTLGQTRSGAIFLTGGGGYVYKRTPGGSWSQVGDLRGRDVQDQDPYLWVDAVSDRVYTGYLFNYSCTRLLWTDDEGASWSANLAASCPPVLQDHPSWATGPRPEGTPASLYYVFASLAAPPFGGTRMVVSRDGGETWDSGSMQAGTEVDPGNECHGGLAGHPVAAGGGLVLVPKATCQGLRIARSTDDGVTWTHADIDAVGMAGGRGGSLPSPAPALPTPSPVPVNPALTPRTGNPGLALDGAGGAYAAWTGADGLLYVSHSKDGSASWSEPVRASPPGINSTVFAAVAAGDAGRIAVAYLATKSPTAGWQGPEAQFAPPETVWHLYVTYSLNADADDPTFVTAQATPESDPVQVGQIWQGGLGVAPSRNLRDFIGIAESQGRLLVAYADGCPKCARDSESRSQDLMVLASDGGPSLRNAILAPFQ